MEGKILAGSHVMEQAKQQELELKKAQKQIAEAKRNEKKLAALALESKEEKLVLQEKTNTVEEQVMKLTTKLEKLWERYKVAQTEIEDLNQEFGRERQDLLETIRWGRCCVSARRYGLRYGSSVMIAFLYILS